ncbi:MAG: hypothetical protein ABSH51_20815 [Solirubrobacteraceae bacterium]
MNLGLKPEPLDRCAVRSEERIDPTIALSLDEPAIDPHGMTLIGRL